MNQINWLLVLAGVALLIPSVIATVFAFELGVPEILDLVAVAAIATGLGVKF